MTLKIVQAASPPTLAKNARMGHPLFLNGKEKPAAWATRREPAAEILSAWSEGSPEARIMSGVGAPGEIRTPDLLLRRQPLYPAELRAHEEYL